MRWQSRSARPVEGREGHLAARSSEGGEVVVPLQQAARVPHGDQVQRPLHVPGPVPLENGGLLVRAVDSVVVPARGPHASRIQLEDGGWRGSRVLTCVGLLGSARENGKGCIARHRRPHLLFRTDQPLPPGYHSK